MTVVVLLTDVCFCPLLHSQHCCLNHSFYTSVRSCRSSVTLSPVVAPHSALSRSPWSLTFFNFPFSGGWLLRPHSLSRFPEVGSAALACAPLHGPLAVPGMLVLWVCAGQSLIPLLHVAFSVTSSVVIVFKSATQVGTWLRDCLGHPHAISECLAFSPGSDQSPVSC